MSCWKQHHCNHHFKNPFTSWPYPSEVQRVGKQEHVKQSLPPSAKCEPFTEKTLKQPYLVYIHICMNVKSSWTYHYNGLVHIYHLITWKLRHNSVWGIGCGSPWFEQQPHPQPLVGHMSTGRWSLLPRTTHLPNTYEPLATLMEGPKILWSPWCILRWKLMYPTLKIVSCTERRFTKPQRGPQQVVQYRHISINLLWWTSNSTCLV